MNVPTQTRKASTTIRLRDDQCRACRWQNGTATVIRLVRIMATIRAGSSPTKMSRPTQDGYQENLRTTDRSAAAPQRAQTGGSDWSSKSRRVRVGRAMGRPGVGVGLRRGG